MGNGSGARLSQEGEEVNLWKGPAVMLRVLPLVQSNSSVSSLTLSLPVSLGVESSPCGGASGNVWKPRGGRYETTAAATLGSGKEH